MGVRIVVRDGEPISRVLNRLKQQLYVHGMTWEMRRRRNFIALTQARRAKRFQKRFKARQTTLLKQMTGEQPVWSLKDAKAAFWKRTGKP